MDLLNGAEPAGPLKRAYEVALALHAHADARLLAMGIIPGLSFAFVHLCSLCKHSRMAAGAGGGVRTPGLRARKRMQTRARIEDAAVSLVLTEGLEHVTVQAISDRAEVSPRTFFNYFDSKDAAILGVGNASTIAVLVEEFLDQDEHEDPIESVVALLLFLFDVPSTRLLIRQDRMELLRRHPELLATQFEQFTHTKNQVCLTVQQILTRHAGTSLAAEDIAGVAPVTLAMCGMAVQIAVGDLAKQHTHADVDQISERAVGLVRTTARSSL